MLLGVHCFSVEVVPGHHSSILRRCPMAFHLLILVSVVNRLQQTTAQAYMPYLFKWVAKATLTLLLQLSCPRLSLDAHSTSEH